MPVRVTCIYGIPAQLPTNLEGVALPTGDSNRDGSEEKTGPPSPAALKQRS